jgi:hypothetical protein
MCGRCGFTKDKIVAMVIAISYLGVALFCGGWEIFFKIAMFLLLPLACIFFSEEMGNYQGFAGFLLIDQKSPGLIISFLGWVLLLLPVIFGLTSAFSER